jgi:class 3 adenylate cyclase
MESPENGSAGERRRFDCVMKLVSADDNTRLAYFEIAPNPKRYELMQHEGVPYYFDRYLHELISKKLFEKMVTKLAGLPVYSLSPRIQSASEYAAARHKAVEAELETGEHIPPADQPLAHKSLAADTTPRLLVFLSVDICGGTSLRKPDPSKFDRAYKVFIQELGTVVGQFNGSIFKLTGDGFIAAIDFPGFTRQCDNAVDMGLSFLRVLEDAINPALHNAGLPLLKIRVGADFGPATISQMGVPSTGFSTLDITSDALNRAVKIEQTCCDNEFRIGEGLFQVLHTDWLERTSEVPFDGDKIGIPGYQVYSVS